MTTVKMERKALVQALRVLAAVTPRKQTIPVLNTVKLSANGDVRLAATDLERSAIVTLARMGGRGDAELALPVERLLKMVRAGSGELIELATDSLPGRETHATLDGAATIIGLDVADFPTLPELTKGELIARLDGAELAEAFRNTEYATTREVVRYALTGVLLDVDAKHKRANMVASDGKRLMSWRLRKGELIADARIIVPVKAFETLLDLNAAGGPVEVRVQWIPAKTKSDEPTAERVIFRVVGAGVAARLIEGRFPDYEAVTPSNLPPAWELNRAELLEALEAMEPAMTEKTRAVRFTFRPGHVTLFAKSADVGEATARAGCEGSSPEVTTTLSPDYIREYLKALPKSVRYVKVQVKDKATATLWRATASDKYVVMPLTVNL